MTDSISNVYELLEDDSAPTTIGGTHSEDADMATNNIKVADSLPLNVADISSDAVESQPWTDVSRTRRLVPQYSLSKEVMGLDNAKHRTPLPITPTATTNTIDNLKKKGWNAY